MKEMWNRAGPLAVTPLSLHAPDSLHARKTAAVCHRGGHKTGEIADDGDVLAALVSPNMSYFIVTVLEPGCCRANPGCR
jgi:hypothetical protein